jgi:hypothetical protein
LDPFQIVEVKIEDKCQRETGLNTALKNVTMYGMKDMHIRNIQ